MNLWICSGTTGAQRPSERLLLLPREVGLLALVLASGLAGPAYADLTIILKNSFIDKYKDRATIEATATVEFSHKKPKKPTESKPSNDGDIHAAIRSDDIQLATVAEIMNAADFLPTVKRLHDMAGTGETVALQGVWRLWPEHGSDETYRQGATMPAYPRHEPRPRVRGSPLTRVGTTDVKGSFKGIPDFHYKDAEGAFLAYKRTPSVITRSASTTKIVTKMVTFNYVEFLIRPIFDGFSVDRPDGHTILSQILDLEGGLLAHRRRLVFVKDTEPYAKFKTLAPGQCMHVLGMPRVNLKLVWYRTTHETAAWREEARKWSLPYEMVIIGLLSPETTCGEEE